jgi:hypothetical protein
MRSALLLTLLALSACAGKDSRPAPMTYGAVPRDGRGEPVLPSPPPPLPPQPAVKPVTQPPINCQHLRHC